MNSVVQICAQAFMMPQECNMASSVVFIVLMHWRHWLWLFSFVSKLWVKSSLAQVCHDMRRNPDEISCRMKLNSDVPNQGPEWTMGDGYPLELDIPDHCISSDWTSGENLTLCQNFLDNFEYGIICLNRSIQYYWNAKGNDHKLHGLFVFDRLLLGPHFVGETMWTTISLPAGYIIHPSLFDGTIHAVCATMFDQDPPFLKIFAGVGKVTVVTKEAGIGKRDTYRHCILINVACGLYEFIYFSDRFNITLKSSASLKVAMVVSGPADIWNRMFVSKHPRESNCMRLLRMKLWFSIWASLRRQISNLEFFISQTIFEWRDFYFWSHGDDLRPKCQPLSSWTC